MRCLSNAVITQDDNHSKSGNEVYEIRSSNKQFSRYSRDLRRPDTQKEHSKELPIAYDIKIRILRSELLTAPDKFISEHLLSISQVSPGYFPSIFTASFKHLPNLNGIS